MSKPLSTERIRAFVRELKQLTAARAKAEADFAAQSAAEHAAIEAEHAKSRARIVERRRNDAASADAEMQQSHAHTVAGAEAELKAIRAEHGKARERALEEGQGAEEAAERAIQEARWTQDAVHEANVKKASSVFEQARRHFAEREKTASDMRQSAVDRHRAWALVPAGAEGSVAGHVAGRDLYEEIDERLAAAHGLNNRFQAMLAPRLLVGDRLLWACFAAWVVVAASGFFFPQWWYGPALATALVSLGGFALRSALASWARSQAVKIGTPLFRTLAEADQLRAGGEAAAEITNRQAIIDSKQRQKDELRRAEADHRKALAAAQQERNAALATAEHRLTQRTKAVSERRDAELGAIEADYRTRTREIDQRADRELAEVTAKHEREQGAFEERYSAIVESMTDAWECGRERLQAELAAIGVENERLFPDWSSPGWRLGPAPTGVPGGMRFGSLDLDVTACPGGQPTDGRLRPFQPSRIALPALLPFPQRGSTLLHVSDSGRAAGVHALQAMMLRFLMSLPPGKVRFTIVDPVGLGENFAAFMHLADHDVQLVNGRIWTEPGQIERRLTDLTAHMENVIQKYLRNQYASIEEYNTQAGEVAEPYRVLVVANFPANFSVDTARRLVSIASSGAACGVYVLASVDAKQPLPQGFSLGDLEQVCLNLSWSGQRFEWEDADFGPLPLKMDAPPDPVSLARTVSTVGERAKQAGRVEVDFSFIAPPMDERWTADSRDGIRVPLGRAGATKRQYLALGLGMAQHVLVAGKTGSGKSTLLHALITNLALHYGPEEVELYLIDFKKGVEFKTYATHDLPHARVVAVESEREFGLSVLQRLDSELKRRGDLYRGAGVQDVASYREKTGIRLPRIMLIVDEFQEFFVEDDKLSQEAALLLDRLVRQGRAFGLHVLLGSQTLGGAYSLARSTIDQMAVRIALQCSEADANLILSKDNNAARLLSRPGEAIYNDANGLMEGNDIFQVVWLPEERREVYLSELQSLAHKRHWQPPAPTIVFEGNHPADLASNVALRRLIGDGGARTPARERLAWLGEALAIKDPTVAAFRRQSGSNLLVIGQQSDAARAVLTAAAVALVAQQTAEERDDLPAVTILDGSPADDPDVGYFARLAKSFTDDLRLANLREKPHGLDRLAEELERRKSDPGAVVPPRFLIVYGLHRFRDLRKADEDFGFGKRGEERTVSPAEQFTELIREGPALGIHVLAWCDTLANVQRAVDRRDLRELEMRVLFQMGVTDSSTLIDSPVASRLGLNRALFATEEMSGPEKFRPYRLPAADWLTGTAASLARAKSACPA